MTNYMNPYIGEDETELPVSAVSDPWVALEDPEAGQSTQQTATTTLPSYVVDQYGQYGQDISGGMRGYSSGVGDVYMGGKARPHLLRNFAVQAGTQLGSGLVGMGISHAVGSGAGATYGAAVSNAAAGGMGETAATETASRMTASAAPGAAAYAAPALAGGMAGYQMSPYGAYVYTAMHGYSPGGLAAPVGAAPGAMAGARTDREAMTARGQRVDMVGTGAVSGAATGATIGAMGGGVGALPGAVIGAIAGGVGGWFQENPYSGKRGYQEAWSYEIEPILRQQYNAGEKVSGGARRAISAGAKGNLSGAYEGIKDMGSGIFKSFDIKGAWDSIKQFGQGDGPKPPSKHDIQRDIQYKMAQNVSMDLAVRDWWNAIAGSSKGNAGEAGREYVMSVFDTEGRERISAEELPNWLQGQWGSGKHPYDFRPEEIDGRRVAPTGMGKYLAALQTEYERLGTEEFYNKYMKDWSIYKEGGSPIYDRWHGKQLYSIPSEIGGMSFQDLFPGVEVPDTFTPEYWQIEQERAEEEGIA